MRTTPTLGGLHTLGKSENSPKLPKIYFLFFIRYWKDKDGAFVNIPSKGILLHKLQDNTVELLLEKSHGRTEMIGPLTSFDPNLALIVDTLGPTIKPKFRAGIFLFSILFKSFFKIIFNIVSK